MSGCRALHEGSMLWGSRPAVECCSCLLVCLTSQQHAGVCQRRSCSGNCTCYHTEIGVAYQTSYLIQSQYTDTGQISTSADPMMPGSWQSSHGCPNFNKLVPLDPGQNPRRIEPRTAAVGEDALPLGQRGGDGRCRAT